MEDVLYKVEDIRKNYKDLDIQMDGGITCSNVDKCAKAGANVIVSGTGIFGHDDPSYAIKYMRDAVDSYN
jgi:ribulose-phosphate 3-epimerase